MRTFLLFGVLVLMATHAAMAQADYKNGTISIDFHKKKKQPQQDTAITTTLPSEEEDENGNIIAPAKSQKARAPHMRAKAGTYDIHELGIFRAIFHAGLNACQVDGDQEWGYKYLGASFGAGVMARFHPYISASLEIDYSMQGARARLPGTDLISRRYQVQWDYVEAPIALNAHYRDIVMVSGGLIPGFMVRYKELDYDGINVTKNPPLGQPRQFALSGFGGLHVFIKKHYGLGFIYRYSLLRIRAANDGTKVNGQYNNLFTFRFVYMLGSLRKPK
ncbi:MAG: hypothetical protein JSS76_12680 [Bacteroidetes bacterium]|nr:hypothetical protein [Bacteroidota bacterium]